MDSEKVREICAHLESTAEMIGFELQPRVSSCDALESIVLGLSELDEAGLRIPANVTGHSGDRDRFAHGHHTGVGFVL